jgi:hypothetical protein
MVNERLSNRNQAKCGLQDPRDKQAPKKRRQKNCKRKLESACVAQLKCMITWKHTLIDLSGTCIFTVNICSIKGSVDGLASATSIRARKLMDSDCNRICENGKIMHFGALLDDLASDASELI